MTDLDDVLSRAAAENVGPRTPHDIYVDHAYPHDRSLYRRLTGLTPYRQGGRHHGALGPIVVLPERAKPYPDTYGPNPPTGRNKHPPITDWLPSHDLTVLDDVIKLIDSPIAARIIRQSHATIASLPARQQKDLLDRDTAYGLQIETLRVQKKAAEDRAVAAERENESLRQQIASLMALLSSRG